MKEVNLISLNQAYVSLNQPLYESYFDYYKINPKKNELVDLGLFIEQLQGVSPVINVFDKYYFGYIIPQISKEFDLLRFGEDFIINIELKSQNTDDKITKQIVRNRYYLSFLKKKIFSFTYISSENKLYTFDETQKLKTVSFKYLQYLLSTQNTITIENLDDYFNPSNYLVSPFNSTEEFIGGGYFLTSHQEEIKKECLLEIEENSESFISICGKAGTGKTLLTFDIAKHLLSTEKKVLIIHCGNLNSGHLKLRDDYGWDVIPIKEYSSKELKSYNLVIVDETQRIFPQQLMIIINELKKNKGNCIFSYDKQQCLRNWEVENNIAQVISVETSSLIFELTEKIRTNKEIASFIIALFNKSRNIEKINRRNIDLIYFQTSSEAKNYLKYMSDYEWKIINYTPSSRYSYPYIDYAVFSEDNAHGVIGQEFDKVVAVIDEFFCYNGNNLSIKNYTSVPYYNPVKMLFQIMTRTRRKLCVVIINNAEILERCISILNYK